MAAHDSLLMNWPLRDLKVNSCAWGQKGHQTIRVVTISNDCAGQCIPLASVSKDMLWNQHQYEISVSSWHQSGIVEIPGALTSATKEKGHTLLVAGSAKHFASSLPPLLGYRAVDNECNWEGGMTRGQVKKMEVKQNNFPIRRRAAES